MKKNKYIEYLKDSSFLRSFFFKNKKDVLYWEDFVIKNPDKKEDVERARQVLSSIKFNDERFSDIEKSKILEGINEKIDVLKVRRRFHLTWRIVAAACFIGVLFGGFLVFNYNSKQELIAEQNQSVNEDEKKTTQLILANNERIVFDNEADIIYKKGGKVISNTENKEILASNVNKNGNKRNKLIVPKGVKASYIVLEDGTKVWVSSGSTFEFPVSFSEKKREVFVKGEIYIEVAKETDRPFYVRTSEMNIKVMGTRFNVSAYPEESVQSVVLVEGLVEVRSKDETKKKVLLPDQMLTLTSNAMNINKVNAYDYISWKDGLLQFSSQSLSDILARLSRFYDVNIHCENDIKQMHCSGKLILFDDISDVLETISQTIPLEKTLGKNVPVTYEIKDDQVYIKKKQ